MQLIVELSDEQLKVLLSAVEIWETHPAREAMITSIMKAAVTGEPEIEDAKAIIAKAEVEMKLRKFMSITLQLKLMNVLANPKKHAAP